MEKLQKWLSIGASVANILALILIPLWIAHLTQGVQSEISQQSLTMQSKLAEQSLKKDYVTLAVGILEKTNEQQPDEGLRQWAAQIVDENASVKLPAGVRERLASGETRLTERSMAEEAWVIAWGESIDKPGLVEGKCRNELTRALMEADHRRSMERYRRTGR